VFYCSTTDHDQVIHYSDPVRQCELAADARHLVRRSLELIREQSTLNVRILTRGPLARADFDLFKTFGLRRLVGMSLPTFRNDFARAYELKAPAPSQRPATLRAAKAAGLHVDVAVAPTYPDCNEADLRVTLQAVAEVEPVTIFHEPTNRRAENVTRIQTEAAKLGIALRTDLFAARESWQDYAPAALRSVERLAGELSIAYRLHFWPDKSLGGQSALARQPDPQSHAAWLHHWWHRISEWPNTSLIDTVSSQYQWSLVLDSHLNQRWILPYVGQNEPDVLLTNAFSLPAK